MLHCCFLHCFMYFFLNKYNIWWWWWWWRWWGRWRDVLRAERRQSVPNTRWRQEEKKQVVQRRRQSSDVISRQLHDELRQTPVEKDSASLLEQDMKKRPSKTFIIIIIIIIIIFRPIRSWQIATNYKNKLIDQSINAFVQHSENEISLS